MVCLQRAAPPDWSSNPTSSLLCASRRLELELTHLTSSHHNHEGNNMWWERRIIPSDNLHTQNQLFWNYTADFDFYPRPPTHLHPTPPPQKILQDTQQIYSVHFVWCDGPAVKCVLFLNPPPPPTAFKSPSPQALIT